MIVRICLIFTFLYIFDSIFASEPKYAVSEIPKPLLENAKAVIRKSNVVFEISSNKSAVRNVTFAITILNQNGIDNSVLKVFYNKFSSIKKIRASVYDQFGKQVKIGSSTSVMDIAVFSAFSLYNDYRVKIFDPQYATTPFTVEFSYEINYDGTLNYPDWVVYDDYNLAIEKSDLTVITPRDFKFRYLEKNFPSKCVQTLNGVKSNYYWEVSGLTAMKKELFSQSLEEYSPVVYLAPVKFEIGGYEGNCSSWQDFGLWILKLNEKRDSLNIQTREHIKSLVAGVNNETDKIKILYNFLQNKVRYVSIQEGIGSWQPIDAETVDKVSYGDCKALANYMKSILDVAGIKSYYTLIGAGENATPLINEFPSNRFNHAIICVPVQNDTIWLECTDQEIPFGYLGTFTDNRKALVISDAGGTIVNTRIYSASDNIQVRTGNVKVDNYGNISSTIHTIYKGVNYDTMMPLLRMDKADKATFINSKINIPGYELVKSEYSEIKSMVPSILEVLNLNIHDYGSIAGNNLIIKPNILSRLQNVPPRAASRNSPIIIRRSRCEYDTINYSLQASVKSEIKPNVFSLNTPFGEYRSEIIIHGNSMKYIRMLKLSRGKYLKENYDSFLNFMEKIMIEDNKQITWTRL